MAVKVRHFKVDDLEALNNPGHDVVAERTIRFSVNEQQWEIDLASANAAGFFDLLRPYQQAGRRVKAPTRSRPKSQRDTTAKIREWAQSNGYKVKEMGRIPRDVVADYERAMAT